MSRLVRMVLVPLVVVVVAGAVYFVSLRWGRPTASDMPTRHASATGPLTWADKKAFFEDLGNLQLNWGPCSSEVFDFVTGHPMVADVAPTKEGGLFFHFRDGTRADVGCTNPETTRTE